MQKPVKTIPKLAKTYPKPYQNLQKHTQNHTKTCKKTQKIAIFFLPILPNRYSLTHFRRFSQQK